MGRDPIFLLTKRWSWWHAPPRAKLIRRLPHELHLTRFPRGKPSTKGLFPQPTDEPMVFIVMKTTPLHSPNRSQLRRDCYLIPFGRRLALPLFFLCVALLIHPCAAQWQSTGDLNVARDYQ